MTYQLTNGVLALEISSIGAELISVKKQGKERLWQNENGGWSGHAPILFPKAGDMQVVFDGQISAMAGHGVARKHEFSLVEKSENKIVLKMTSDEGTKAVYPYDFVLFVTYEIEDAKLKIEYKMENLSSVPAYAYFGSHESYALDGEIDEYEAVFPEEETFDSLIHNGDIHGLTGEVQSFGKGKKLAFPKAFMEDNTLIFANVNSRSVELWKRGGERIATLWFDGFEHLLFWHPAESKMVCMEPWQNLPDFPDDKGKEFSKKSGVREIEPKTSLATTHIIEY
jgi:galactose mutarotase-like enzyme